MVRKALRNTPAVVLTGETRGVLGPLSRDCPTCGAAAGVKCVRTTGGRVGGEDIGGEYAVTLKSFHAKRKKWTPPADMADPDVVAATAATQTLPYVHLTAEGMSAVNLCASTLDTTRDDAINRAVIYYCRYVLGEIPI